MVSKKLLFLVVFLLSLGLLGCGEEEKVVPDKIVLKNDACITAAIDSYPVLKAFVSGKLQEDQNSSSGHPAADIELVWKILSKPEGSETTVSAENSETDAGGVASASLSGIDKSGVYVVEVGAAAYPRLKKAKVTILGGISIAGNDQDGWAQTVLERPITITTEDSGGKPLSGVKLSFDLRKAPSGSKLFVNSGVTDAEGMASLGVKLGNKQGGGEIGVNVISAPWIFEDVAPTIKINFFSIDIWKVILGVAGGLAIFIYGMRQMSDGLSLIAGEKLKSLLNFLTSNRFAAVGIGALVTGFIQSSSACTVMVIGFVNAGLMSLEQAIGVVMGANIGTTITAQMLSFKLSSLAPVAVSIGVLMAVTAKKSNTKFIAQILIGFGLLFFGMGMMSAPLKELKDAASVRSIFSGLSCLPDASGFIPLYPFFKAILAGTLLTVIVQSSSAAIGLLLTLAGAGLLDVYAGFGILLGTNIGTTITAILASIGSTRTAKRTACAHVIFNIAGTVAMILLINVQVDSHPAFLDLVAKFTAGNPFQGENLVRFLANAHTLFNISCTAVFVWFLAPLAYLTCRIIPSTKATVALDKKRDRSASKVLDPHLIATPAIALEQAWYEIVIMLQKGQTAITTSSNYIISKKEGSSEQGSEEDDSFEVISSAVSKLEKDVDNLQTAVTDYVTNISQERLTEEQGRALPRLLHSVNDAERIGDHSMHILRLARRVRKRNLGFSDLANQELGLILKELTALFAHADRYLKIVSGEEGVEEGNELERKERFREAKDVADRLKRLAADYRKNHIARQELNECDLRTGMIYMDMLQNLNRVGGHLFNVIQAIYNR